MHSETTWPRWKMVALSCTQLAWGGFYISAWQSVLSMPSGAQKVGALIFLTIQCLLWLVIVPLPAVYWHNWRRHRLRWSLLAAATVSTVAFILITHSPDTIGVLNFLAVESILLIGAPWSLIEVGLILATYVIVGWTAPATWSDNVWTNGAICFVISVAVFGTVQLLVGHRMTYLMERDMRTLAVDAERGRIARDLHDDLGATLTTIGARSELASSLARAGHVEQAADTMDEVAALARSSLAEARRTISGLRALSLSDEIEAARVLLTASGIEFSLVNTVDVVDPRWMELFASVVREGSTNIVQHSTATHAVLTVESTRLSLADDGRGWGSTNEHSSGLIGLRMRAQSVGAHLGVTREGGQSILTVQASDTASKVAR